MPRPRLEIGEYGNVSTKKGANGWTAFARYRDNDGVTRPVTASGTTEDKARVALRQKISRRKRTFGDISADVKVSELAETWYLRRSRDHVKYRTLERARSMLNNHIIPKMGAYMVRECTTGRLDVILNAIADKHGVDTAAIARSTMSGIMSYAVRMDLIATNPIKETKLPSKRQAPIRALSATEFAAMRAHAIDALRPLNAAERLSRGGGESARMGGRPRSQTPLDVIDFLMATGCRASEVLGTCWEDVHLDVDIPYVVIRQQVIRRKKNSDGTGGGLFLEPTKEEDTRIIALPSFAVEMLTRRRKSAVSNRWHAVFTSASNTLVDPRTMRRQWQQIFKGSAFEWVTQKTLRKTVATLLDAHGGSEIAAKMLGHVSDRMTKKHYIEPSQRPIDQRAAIEQFGTA